MTDSPVSGQAAAAIADQGGGRPSSRDHWNQEQPAHVLGLFGRCPMLGEEGTVKQFLIVGVDEETIARIGHYPPARTSWDR
ncbi:hypothetical protein ACFCYB_22510 [Streptomyces sp. NPDC056309]|uniref:hypothetical protein n=1 Tax=unclassified Streptomyces TaxID=2593676 RepID=UPI0035DFCB49